MCQRGLQCPVQGSRTVRPGQTANRGKGSFPGSFLIRVAVVPEANSTILVIDDDPDVRASVGRLLRSLNMNVQLFASISDFLKSDPPDRPTCLVLDVRLPGQSGLDLQRELAAANRELPIIFITGPGDIPMSEHAMKGGAIEYRTEAF